MKDGRWEPSDEDIRALTQDEQALIDDERAAAWADYLGQLTFWVRPQACGSHLAAHVPV